MKLAGRKTCFIPPYAPMVYSTDRSKAVVPAYSLLICGLFYEAICCMFFACVILFLCFSVLLALR